MMSIERNESSPSRSQLFANREIARTGSGRSDDGPIREVMWSNRAEQLRDLTLSVGIDAADCLERVEYVARQCRRYNIDADLEVLRNDSGQAADRHCVWCVGPNQPLWVMHLVLAKIGPSNTHVVLGVARFRRQATGIVAGRAVVGFRQMVQRALTAADEPRRPGNVIDLRSYAALRTSA